MKKCRDIENLLPLYPEGILSDAEKRAVDEHLSGCAICQKELAYLQKAGDLVDQLPQVEEPPWFQQKIMARVREEAGKKSFAQKWFYPLRIKIPLQIMATLVIAVLAVYIYRSGDEQVKQILPGASKPALEMQKEQMPAQMLQAGDRAAPVVPRDKVAVREEVRHDKQSDKMDKTVMSNMAAGGSVQKSEAPESKPGVAYEADAYKAKGLEESKDEANEALPTKQNDLDTAKPQMANQEIKAAAPVLAKKRESYKMAAPAAPRAMVASVAIPLQAKVFVRVFDLNAAVSDVEKILAKWDAKKVTKQLAEGAAVIRAEVSGKHWKDVLSKLKGVGQVEEKIMPTDIGERSVNVMIEISGP